MDAKTEQTQVEVAEAAEPAEAAPAEAAPAEAAPVDAKKKRPRTGPCTALAATRGRYNTIVDYCLNGGKFGNAKLISQKYVTQPSSSYVRDMIKKAEKALAGKKEKFAASPEKADLEKEIANLETSLKKYAQILPIIDLTAEYEAMKEEAKKLKAKEGKVMVTKWLSDHPEFKESKAAHCIVDGTLITGYKAYTVHNVSTVNVGAQLSTVAETVCADVLSACGDRIKYTRKVETDKSGRIVNTKGKTVTMDVVKQALADETDEVYGLARKFLTNWSRDREIIATEVKVNVKNKDGTVKETVRTDKEYPALVPKAGNELGTIASPDKDWFYTLITAKFEKRSAEATQRAQENAAKNGKTIKESEVSEVNDVDAFLAALEQPSLASDIKNQYETSLIEDDMISKETQAFIRDFYNFLMLRLTDSLASFMCGAKKFMVSKDHIDATVEMFFKSNGYEGSTGCFARAKENLTHIRGIIDKNAQAKKSKATEEQEEKVDE